MNKLFLGFVLIALLLAGCSNAPGKQTCYQREVKYTEGSPVALCSENFVEYEFSNVKISIEPRPNQADHQYDVGIMDFTILNKDKRANGYFNLSMECVMPSGNTIEKTSIFLAAGQINNRVELKCSKRGTITSLNGPTADSVPMTQNCPSGSVPVEKTRLETVCE